MLTIPQCFRRHTVEMRSFCFLIQIDILLHSPLCLTLIYSTMISWATSRNRRMVSGMG